MAALKLSAEHLAAVGRHRRIIDQLDASDVLLSVGSRLAPGHDWLQFVFAHADSPGSAVDTICWDVGPGEETYALHQSDLLPAWQCPDLERWRAAGIAWLGALVEGCHERGVEAFWCSRVSEVDLANPYVAGVAHGHPSTANALKQSHPDWLLRCWWWQGLWDLSSAGFRAHKVAVLRELAEAHAFDGFELDLARHTPFLAPGRQWELRGHATAFVREVRGMLLR
jgi:hypothetical protein